MKNVAGYDVSRVLAGSLGTLGLIAEVSLKVLPVAPAEATLRFQCDQADALRLLNGWGGQPLPLNASRWTADAGGTLWLRLRGAAAAVASACAHLGGERQDDAQAQAEWQAARDQRLAWFGDGAGTGGDLWRLSVPQTAPVLALDGAPLVEWHGGQRWYVASAGESERLRAAAARRRRPRDPVPTRRLRPHGRKIRRARTRAGAHPCRADTRIRPPRRLRPRTPPSRRLTRMQTDLAPEFQGTADGKEAEAILRKCVHCGFCTATCPTYQLLGDELDGPRGRIYLIKQVLEGEAPTRSDPAAPRPLPDLPQLRKHLPVSGVQYGHLVDIGRQASSMRRCRARRSKARCAGR